MVTENFFFTTLYPRFTLSADFEPDSEIRLLRNSSSSKWADVTVLVHAQDVDILSDDQIDNDSFLEAMKDASSSDPSVGISWRWALSAKPDGSGIELVLQVFLVTKLF
ncbi:MAG: hypothetical protein FJ333_10520 [Sphingomonadales bacterium]|nr:hypothetical protein [Sphingomonadales bacterium]